MGELSELCPVQFIEGVNENEEPTKERFVQLNEYGIAIPYIPDKTFTIVALEVFGSPKHIPGMNEQTMEIYTDHDDKPGKTSVATAKLTLPEEIGEQWLRFQCNESAVLFAKHRYWLAINAPLVFSIGFSESGRDISPRANPQGHWQRHHSGGVWKFMLRFYGKVLPVTIG